MELSLTQSLMMGLFSGLTEPMAMSPEAHRGLLQYMFGVDSVSPVLTLAAHVAVLVVLLMSAPLELGRLNRSWKQLRLPPRRRTHQPELNSVNTIKLLKTSVPVVVAGTLLGTYLSALAGRLSVLVVALSLGGVLLWLPGHYRTGNKDARNLVPVDGWILGGAAALGAVPGLSAVGMCMSAASVRGVDRRYALRYAWILLMVRLLVVIVYDALQVAGTGLDLGWMEILKCLAGAAAAAGGAWLAVRMMLSHIKEKSITGFCYYSWGMALLCLVLYLMV